MSNGRGCAVARCGKPHEGHGFCSTHLARLKRGLDPHVLSNREMTPLQRFHREVNKNGGIPTNPYRWDRSMGECWLWTGSMRGLYGVVHADGERIAAHVFSYSQLVGVIPDGHQTDHLCMNKICVNPLHLEPVTSQENVRRAEETLVRGRYKTVCCNGHVFAEVGFYVANRSKGGGRQCKQCAKDKSRIREAIGRPKRPHRCCQFGHEYTPDNTRLSGARRYCVKCEAARLATRELAAAA